MLPILMEEPVGSPLLAGQLCDVDPWGVLDVLVLNSNRAAGGWWVGCHFWDCLLSLESEEWDV
jgi:hypothetical protein